MPRLTKYRAVAAACLTLLASSLFSMVAVWGQASPDAERGDWGASCTPSACLIENTNTALWASIQLRAAPKDKGWTIIFGSRDIYDPDRPLNLKVDQRLIATLRPKIGFRYSAGKMVISDPAVARDLISAMKAGKILRIEAVNILGAPHDDEFNISGLEAAFGRLKLEGLPALEGIAPQPSFDFGPETSRTELISAMPPPERLVRLHSLTSGCEALDPVSLALKGRIGPKAVAVSMSKTAVVFVIPCSASGARVKYRIWQIETGEIGGMFPLYFAIFDPKFGWRGTDTLTDVEIDQDKGTLEAVWGELLPGGCAGSARWRWKDFAFALDEATAGPCAGLKSATKVYPPK